MLSELSTESGLYHNIPMFVNLYFIAYKVADFIM